MSQFADAAVAVAALSQPRAAVLAHTKAMLGFFGELSPRVHCSRNRNMPESRCCQPQQLPSEYNLPPVNNQKRNHAAHGTVR